MNYSEIIEKYNKELSLYSNEILPYFNKYVSKNQKHYKKIIDALFNFYMLNAYLLDKGILIPTPLNDPIMFIFAKSSLTLLGMHSCLKNGLIIDGATLLRSLFEPYIDLKLILEADTEDRLILYSNYRHISNWLTLDNQRNHLREGKMTQENFNKVFSAERIKKFEDEYDKVKDNYHPKHPYSWAWKIFKKKDNSRNPSFKTICKKLGKEKEYEDLYATMSIVAHSSPVTDNFMKINNKKTLLPIYSESLLSIGCYGLHIVQRITSNVLDFMEPDNANDVKIFSLHMVNSTLKEFGFIV